MSFAVQYRQGKKESAKFEIMAYAICGFIGCLVVGAIGIGVAIWNTQYNMPAGRETVANARPAQFGTFSSVADDRNRVQAGNTRVVTAGTLPSRVSEAALVAQISRASDRRGSSAYSNCMERVRAAKRLVNSYTSNMSNGELRSFEEAMSGYNLDEIESACSSLRR